MRRRIRYATHPKGGLGSLRNSTAPPPGRPEQLGQGQRERSAGQSAELGPLEATCSTPTPIRAMWSRWSMAITLAGYWYLSGSSALWRLVAPHGDLDSRASSLMPTTSEDAAYYLQCRHETMASGSICDCVRALLRMQTALWNTP